MSLIQTRSMGHCGGHDHDNPLEHCIFSLDNKPVPNPTERPVWLKGVEVSIYNTEDQIADYCG